jgi:hypothetical protein
MTGDDMNTLLYSRLSLYDQEQNEPLATQAERRQGSEQEAAPFKEHLRSSAAFLFAAILMSLIAFAGVAVIVNAGAGTLP